MKRSRLLQRLVDQLNDYQVVLEPDRDTPDWWAGAPSALRAADGTVYLAARMREGDSVRGKRGYELRILRSEDAVHFEPVAQLTREAASLAGFERPALVTDPATGKFRLYACAPLDDGWSILVCDDVDDPSRFDPATLRPVLSRRTLKGDASGAIGYKDPVVFWDGDQWHMFTIGFLNIERIHHFVSADGLDWRRGEALPLIGNTGWHNHFVRPASVVPLEVGYLFVYEGSHEDWHDPDYNIATGLAYTPDLARFADLTPDEPLLKTTTPGDYHTWRYSHWLRAGGKLHVYFEAARPNSTNEIRVAVVEPPRV